jgi:cellobiose-specific phosphotransferase system component IIC
LRQEPLAPIEPEGILDGLRWGCIIRGALLDIGLTVAASIPLLLVLAGPAAFSEDADTANEAMDQALASPEGLFWTMVIGLLATVGGGYYGARRAGSHHLRHGGWVAVVSLTLGLPFVLLSGGQGDAGNPFWYDALSIVCMLPAGLLGGIIARRLGGAAA